MEDAEGKSSVCPLRKMGAWTIQRRVGGTRGQAVMGGRDIRVCGVVRAEKGIPREPVVRSLSVWDWAHELALRGSGRDRRGSSCQ